MFLRIIKTTLVGLIWTYLYVRSTQLLFIYAWNFDYLSPSSWQKIIKIWNDGGAIKKGKDFLFIFALLLLIPTWLYGWRLFYKINYLNILLFPFIWYNKHTIKKCGRTSNRTLLKNVGKSSKIQDEVKNKIESIKPQEWNEADKIRSAIREKLEDTQNKQ